MIITYKYVYVKISNCRIVHIVQVCKYGYTYAYYFEDIKIKTAHKFIYKIVEYKFR